MFNLLEDTDHPIIQEICFGLAHIASISSISHPAGAIVPGGNRTISFLFPAHGHKAATFAPERAFEQREIILGLLAEYIMPKLGLNGKETLISHIGFMVSDTHKNSLGGGRIWERHEASELVDLISEDAEEKAAAGKALSQKERDRIYQEARRKAWEKVAQMPWQRAIIVDVTTLDEDTEEVNV